MNVNLSQPEASLQESNIRRALRQRKYATENENVEEIKPFRSFRKQRQVEGTGESLMEGGLLRQYGQPLKLKRQYPSDSAVQRKPQILTRQVKYRYELDAPLDENAPPQDYLVQSTKKNIFDSVQKEKIKPELIRKNIKSLQGPFMTGNAERRKQVQSIIFDSKVSKMQLCQQKTVKYFTVSEEIGCDRNVLIFQEKVNKVNDEIQAGLTHIEKMIDELKKKKVAQSQIQAELKKQTKLQQLEREFAERRAQMTENQKATSQHQSKLRKKEEEEANKLIEAAVEQEKLLNSILSKERSSFKIMKDPVADSQIQLQGDFNSKDKPFPTQYISFINRLSNQIERDVAFTNKITELTKANFIKNIRNLIFSQIQKHKSSDIQIDQTFFQIQPSEIDPLDQGKPGWFKKLTEEELQTQAMKVFKMYKDIESHYSSKLISNFSQSTIEMLFEELTRFNFTKTSLNDEASVTVGHLLSYLNMRTNKSFRNRSFVKMSKRLGLKSNGFLTINIFSRLMRQ